MGREGRWWGKTEGEKGRELECKTGENSEKEDMKLEGRCAVLGKLSKVEVRSGEWL